MYFERGWHPKKMYVYRFKTTKIKTIIILKLIKPIHLE